MTERAGCNRMFCHNGKDVSDLCPNRLWLHVRELKEGPLLGQHFCYPCTYIIPASRRTAKALSTRVSLILARSLKLSLLLAIHAACLRVNFLKGNI
jgi:hypothetical protein